MPEHLTSTEVVFDNGRTQVWRSHDDELGATIHKGAIGGRAPERLAHEASILRRLERVHGVPRLRPSLDPCVLVYADSGGRVLGEVLGERRLRAGEVVAVGERLAWILSAVHEAGVFHRDLHPWNLLLADDGQVEIIDFDLATTVAEVRPSFTAPREILGRLPYLSPEQTGRTAAAVDNRSDLYGLGAVLYEMATGRPPFVEQDAFDLVRDILTREPVPVAQLEPTMPPALTGVIARLLEKEPDCRYQSAAGLAHDLARIAADPAATFSPGERDFPSRLSAPVRLIGRDAEIAVLAEAVDAITRQGATPWNQAPACRVVLVAGRPGVGKSALIDELRPLIIQQGGWFVTGKSDQFRRDSSTGLHRALRQVGRLLLAETPAVLEELAQLIKDGVGSNAAILLAMAPEFAQIIGVPADAGEVDERELEDRTRRTVVELLRAVASRTRPLVVFLDDIQWAPLSVLDLVGAVIDDGGVNGLLVVGAYRDGELDEARLADVQAGWKRRGVAPTTLRLDPLEPAELATLLGHVLRLPAEQSGVLAEILWDRTAGNPFDTIELLNSLRADHALAPAEGGWVWDAAVIRRHTDVTDVVALLTAQIADLGPDASDVLAAMAYLGGEVTPTDLAVACGLTDPELAAHLVAPLEADLITSVAYSDTEKDAVLRFRHDRVQQAAVERLGPEHRGVFQARIGRRLAVAGRDLHAARLLLASGVPVLDPQQRGLVVGLYRSAADDARRRTDFGVAERYLAAAAAILRQDGSDTAARAQFAVESDRHQLLYQLGRLDEADDVYAALHRDTEDARKLAPATAIQVASLTNRRRFQPAIELGLGALADMGMHYPQGDAAAEITADLRETAAWAARLDAVADVGRPGPSDPTALAIAAVMDRLSAPAFFTAPLVSGWLVTRAKRLWAEHGPSNDLMGALAHGHMALVALLDEYRAGETLMTYLLEVGVAHRWERAVAYTRFFYAASSAHWFAPLDTCAGIAREARDGLLHLGDLPQTCWAYFPLIVNTFEAGPHLDRTLAEVTAALTLADRTGIVSLQHCYTAIHRFCRTAQGGNDDAPGPALPDIDEQAIAEMAKASPTVDTYRRLFLSIAAAVAGDADLLGAHSRAAHRQAQLLPGTVVNLVATVPFGLDLSLQLRHLPPHEPAHAERLAELDAVLAWLRRRGRDQPDNVAHLVHYLEGERAWALDDIPDAFAAFDAALSTVQRLSRPWHRALISRRAGELHREQGLEHSGRLHLAEARQALLDWGADALAAEMERAHPFLRERPATGSHVRSSSTSSSPSRLTSDAIDTTAVLRVAQALAAQTTMAQLHATVVDQLSTITGATAVQLVLGDEAGGWHVHRATGTADHPVLDSASAAAALPVSAVRYVLRTREALAVDDATSDDRFAQDPYVDGRQRLALLVVPVLRSGDLRAVLVLENHLTSGTFTGDRLGLVDMLTGQLAVALDNAQLYASLEHRIAERTEALRSANAQLELLSATDALTGVANRRRFDAALVTEWTRAPGVPMAVIMIDVDHFKKYNDHLGHPTGDTCLIEISRLLAGSLRDTDLLCRYGGEEFAVVLPRAGRDTAVAAAERMRTAVERAALPHAPSVGIVTVSVGVAAALADPQTPAADLLATADAALYEAKQAGRNRVRAG